MSIIVLLLPARTLAKAVLIIKVAKALFLGVLSFADVLPVTMVAG
jgi:hypothetical protein